MEVAIEKHDGIVTPSQLKIGKSCQEIPILEREYQPIVSSIHYDENLIRSLLLLSQPVTIIKKRKTNVGQGLLITHEKIK